MVYISIEGIKTSHLLCPMMASLHPAALSPHLIFVDSNVLEPRNNSNKSWLRTQVALVCFQANSSNLITVSLSTSTVVLGGSTEAIVSSWDYGVSSTMEIDSALFLGGVFFFTSFLFAASYAFFATSIGFFATSSF